MSFPRRREPSERRRRFRPVRILWVLAVPVAVVLLLGLTACTDRPEAGQIGVVRNGGPIDNKNIREILHPGAGTSWIGWGSTTHFYPAAFVQRYYTITSDAGRGDRPGVDVAQVQTADGILVGLEGTFYLNTAFDGSPDGDRMLKEFDNKFGTRTFPVGDSGRVKHAWDGDTGWAAFLDAILRPVIDNELRQAIARFRCEELISSCALVASQGGKATVGAEAGRQTNVNLQRVQAQIDTGLDEDIEKTLGASYFKGIRFRLSRVTLPQQLQLAINEAQAQFAQVSKAKAQVRQAEQQRLAGLKLAQLYERAPALAQIEMIRELSKLPQGSNVYIGVQPVVGAPASR
jgi:hypothetical protein